MYLLDTNIVSTLDPRRADRFDALVRGIDRNGAALHLSVLTLMEMHAGALKLRREGKDKRAGQIGALIAAIRERFESRILPIDTKVSLRASELAERALPNRIDLIDLLIAATADMHGLIVLTHNLRHFAPMGVRAIDPLVALPEDLRAP